MYKPAKTRLTNNNNKWVVTAIPLPTANTFARDKFSIFHLELKHPQILRFAIANVPTNSAIIYILFITIFQTHSRNSQNRHLQYDKWKRSTTREQVEHQRETERDTPPSRARGRTKQSAARASARESGRRRGSNMASLVSAGGTA